METTTMKNLRQAMTMSRTTCLWLVQLAPLASFILASQAMAQQSLDVEDIARVASPAVITIRVYNANGDEIGLGSGFFIPDGRLVTNHHVVAGGSWVEILDQDGSFLGTVSYAEAQSSRLDLAILPAVGSPRSRLQLALSAPEQGQPIIVIGSPEGLGNSISDGIVSAIRPLEGRRLIQLTAPISSGSSGGPVLNAQGHVVGVTVSTLSTGQNLNFAVPVEDVRALADSPPTSLTFGPPLTDPLVSHLGQDDIDLDYVEITVGEEVTGELSASDLELDGGERTDIYYFWGSLGESVQIRMTSDVVDSYVALAAIDDDRTIEIGEDDDSGGGLDAELDAVLTVNGIYIIMATTYEANDFGSYRLSLSRRSASDETVDVPVPAAGGETVMGQLAGIDGSLLPVNLTDFGVIIHGGILELHPDQNWTVSIDATSVETGERSSISGSGTWAMPSADRIRFFPNGDGCTDEGLIGENSVTIFDCELDVEIVFRF